MVTKVVATEKEVKKMNSFGNKINDVSRGLTSTSFNALTLTVLKETLTETFAELIGWKRFCIVFYIELTCDLYWIWQYNISIITKILLTVLAYFAYIKKWPKPVACIFAVTFLGYNYNRSGFLGFAALLVLFLRDKLVYVLVKMAWKRRGG